MEYDIGPNESVSAVENRNCRVSIENGEYLTLRPLESRLHQPGGQEPTDGSVGSRSSGR